ncbi:MAG TPA: BTAD domain-containing putative transcriptional regulator, partial [Anaeromyxobacter sp.]|nr:BTAD domain-containing putative transcriptional regulator [Anaeromyxobacter sp.]
ARDTGVHAWDYLLHLQRVNAALAADDLASARASLATAARAVDASRPLNLTVLEHERGLVALRAGEIDAARECARVTERLGAGSGLPFAVLIARLKLVLAATLGGAADARAELDRTRDVERRRRSSLADLVCELCEADLSLRAGDEEAARQHVARGLRVVREKGVAPDVWFSREQLAHLCAVALDGGGEAECARALVRRLGLAAPAASAHLDAWPWPARVRLLGVLEAEVDDRRLRFRGRSQRRPLEVLGAIAAFGGEGVAEHAVEDALWPDSEGAHHALETSLYRLRRMLGGAIVAHRDRLLTLDRQRCWVDTIAFEAALACVSSKLERRDLAGALRAAERAVSVYRGPFLADSDEPWVLSARSRLRRRWQRAVADLASHGVEPGRLHDLCARAMTLDPALDAALFGGSNVAV